MRVGLTGAVPAQCLSQKLLLAMLGCCMYGTAGEKAGTWWGK
jgi:hypothetical protein